MSQFQNGKNHASVYWIILHALPVHRPFSNHHLPSPASLILLILTLSCVFFVRYRAHLKLTWNILLAVIAQWS